MYTEKIKTQDEALTHLLFHCCLKDGRFSKSEIDAVSEIFVKAGLHGKMNFKDEVIRYRAYQPSIVDDKAYVEFLVQLIKPANELALFSYCIELSLGDAELSLPEEKLLETIATALNISATEQEIIKRLAAQRKVVETQQLF